VENKKGGEKMDKRKIKVIAEVGKKIIDIVVIIITRR